MLPLRRSWLSFRRAATSIEYALIASLVSVFIITGVSAVGVAVGGLHDEGVMQKVVAAIDHALGGTG